MRVMVAVLLVLACTGCATVKDAWDAIIPGSPGSPESDDQAGAAGRPTPAGTGAHRVHSLDGAWSVWLDPGAVGLDEDWAAELSEGRTPAGASGGELTLRVPGPLEGSRETLGYDGVAFYVREFVAPPHPQGARVTLRFDQVNHSCRVWLDGMFLGSHEGGYDAFSLDASGRLRPGARQRLVVMVIDPGGTPVHGLTLKTTPHSKESWYENHGGLLGSVSLAIDDDWVVERLQLVPDPRAGALDVALSLLAPFGIGPHPLKLEVSIRADGEDDVLASRSIRLPHAAGRMLTREMRLEVPEPRAWSPEDPQLYALTVELNGERTATRRFGFRTIEVAGGDILLNGERRVLKGVLYQPHHTGWSGVTPSAEQLEREVLDILDTGFDLVRVHVRPAAEAFLDAADRHGLLVLQEPAIGWVDDDPELLRRMKAELDWMVARDRHHPSIILWGVLNELSGKAYRSAEPLARHLAALDPERPVLVDSGGFLVGGRMLPPDGAGEPIAEMVDEHVYPPYPLPIEEREELVSLRGSGNDLVFVSEFGYGTLLDAEQALAGFTARGMELGDEAVKFRSYANLARRLADRGEPGGDPARRAQADLNQADAAEDMIEALRCNPDVDLLCYTQWRAASAESSAGLLAPWGEARPARERVRHALRPLLVVVQPEHPSVETGEAPRCRLVVVNDTGAPVSGELRLRTELHPPDGLQVAVASDWMGAPTFPEGVTTRTLELPVQERAGELRVQASLERPDDSLAVSTQRVVQVVAPPELTPGLGAVWAPGADARARAFLRHAGFRVVRGPDEPFAAALIARPEHLAEELTVDERLALWNLVWQGGAAVVLAISPGEGEQEEMLGGSRGIRTLTGLPVAPAIGAAPGNFMGRLHLARPEAGTDWTPLGRGDEVLSPRAMFVGPLPPGSEQRMITLGHLGNRIGAPEIVLPFGRGRFHLIGVPLLDIVGDRVDPRRDARLAHAVRGALQWSARNLPDGERVTPDPLLASDAAALDLGLELIDRVIALGDRASPITSAGQGTEPRLPPGPAAALALRNRAIEALLDGRREDCFTTLRTAVEQVWTEDLQRFLALEAVVLDQLAVRVDAETDEGWDLAYDAVEMWARAIALWYAGDAETALDWLGRAELHLGTEAGA
ncbi:MAG: glycoside hydrolase family 2 protein [Planctomycetota bacterium]|jgi:hypothetical protein